MEPSSVRHWWRARHDLIRQPQMPNGVVPHRTRSVEEAELATAQREARLRARLSTADPTYACSDATTASFRLRREA